jgi:hypothetical protein
LHRRRRRRRRRLRGHTEDRPGAKVELRKRKQGPGRRLKTRTIIKILSLPPL